MMSIVNITADNFQEEVISSDKPVLLDFFATWCGPCSMVSPILDAIAEERPDIKVCKVNIDGQVALARKYRVMSVPTILLIKGGEKVASVVGAHTKEEFLQMIDSH